MKRKSKPKAGKKFSLLQPAGMGGIYGGDGYKFQDGYIVCRVPTWMANPNFLRFMPEGTGDVDVVFKDKNRQVYEHVQIKDHEVGGTEFKKVIETFANIDKGTEKIYTKFTLAAPSVGKNVKAFLNKLKRYKEAKPLYDKNNAAALQSTEVDLKKEFAKLKITQFSDFIERKAEFDIGQSDFANNDVCKKLFVSALAEHPRYKKKLMDVLRPAYAVILNEVFANRGKVLDGKKIHTLIDSVISGKKGWGNGTVLHVHNWTVEKFDNKPKVVIDWSKYFDRQNRKVPDAKAWNGKLIPQLFKVKTQISKNTPNRHLIFRGKVALSTGVALGIAFPEVGNWSFELLQPPQPETWRSDAEKIKNYKLKFNIVSLSSLGLKGGGSEIIFIFNITGKALAEVVRYFKENKISVKAIIQIQPGNVPGNLALKNDSEAVSLASAAKNIIKESVVKYKAKKTHLFFYGPLALAIFLGQKLTSVGPIQLYEFQDPGYKPSCLIKT